MRNKDLWLSGTREGTGKEMCVRGTTGGVEVPQARETLALSLQKEKVGGKSPELAAERLMENTGCRLLAHRNRQAEGGVVGCPQPLWTSLALNFLGAMTLFVQRSTHTQTGDRG